MPISVRIRDVFIIINSINEFILNSALLMVKQSAEVVKRQSLFGGPMHFRGIMLDCARCLENRAYYRKTIEFLASRGVNVVLWHFTDDQGCTMQFDSVEGIASPNA